MNTLPFEPASLWDLGSTTPPQSTKDIDRCRPLISPSLSRETSRSLNNASPASWTGSMPVPAHTNGAIGQKPWNLKRTGSSSSMDFGSNHNKPPNSASITSAVHSDPQPDDYWSRYQQIKSADQTRNALIEVLSTTPRLFFVLEGL